MDSWTPLCAFVPRERSEYNVEQRFSTTMWQHIGVMEIVHKVLQELGRKLLISRVIEGGGVPTGSVVCLVLFEK